MDDNQVPGTNQPGQPVVGDQPIQTPPIPPTVPPTPTPAGTPTMPPVEPQNQEPPKESPVTDNPSQTS